MKHLLKTGFSVFLSLLMLILALGISLLVHADPDEGESSSEGNPEQSSEETCTHVFSEYGFDENEHWQVCTLCHAVSEGSIAQHVFPETPSAADGDSKNHRYTCSVCGYVKEEPHEYKWYFDADSHWQICASCGKRTEETAHRPDREEATEDDPILCLDCGYEIAPTLGRYTIRIADDNNADCLDFEDHEYYLTGVKQYSAVEGEVVKIFITDPEEPSIYTVVKLLFTDFEGKEDEEIEVDGDEYVEFTMPDHDVLVQAELDVDEEKAEESIAEVSRSIEESAYLASSIEESIAESKRLPFGSYTLETDVSSVTPPKNFIRANDVSNFERTVGCFYSTDYRIFVYYASADKKNYDYYVLDRIGNDLIPFVSFPGTGNTSYVVSAPASERDIPGIFRQETPVTLNFATGSEPVTVPGFMIVDPDGDPLTLLYLNDDQGTQQFFVYDRSSGTVELTEYNRYEERKKTGETEEDDKIVISTVSPTESEAKPGKTELSRGVIWLIIVGVIVILLAASLITVFIMSKQQEAKERELDEEDEEEPIPAGDEAEEVGTAEPFAEEEEVPETFDTTLYKNPDPSDMDSKKEAADFDFENAFPVAGGLSGAGAQAGGGEPQVETEKIIDFEEIEEGSPEETKKPSEESDASSKA